MVGLARKPNRIDIVACLDLALSVDLAGIWIDEAEAVANHGEACWLSLSPTNAPASIAFNAGTLAPAVPRG